MNTLKRRGRHLWSTMSEKAKNFSVQRSSKVHPQKRKKKAPHSCISPELACDVIKRRITDKVIWTSLILRLTFHLIWVSMTARDVHGKVGSLFQQLIRLAKTSGQDNKKKTKSQKSPREKKGGGGVYRYFSSSHKGLLVCVFPQLVDGRPPSLPYSSLRFWTVLHRCASDLKCWPLSFSHVEPLQLNRATHTRTEEEEVFPPRLSLTLRTGDSGKSEEPVY